MYKVTGSILSDDSEILTGVEIAEVNEFMFPTGAKTETDADGKFTINLQSERSSITISLIGFIPQMITGKDFMKDSLLYLSPAITVKGKKDSNVLLYGLLTASLITILVMATRPEAKPKSAPKQIKIK